MFAAGFLQTGERIATFSSRFAAGAATDFSFFKGTSKNHFQSKKQQHQGAMEGPDGLFCGS
jgi:uncharacterized protein (DUF2252 family)